ncbi:MAG: ribonuclease HII [Pseudomonadota bacterium]
MSATDSLAFDALPEGPDFSIESRLIKQGKRFIAGVDEAGRGPLAGPVVAAAVVLDPDAIPDGLDDSKKLTERGREELFEAIVKHAHVAWASVPATVIDRINIRQATLLAMTRSVQPLPVLADAVMIDGKDVPQGLLAIGSSYVKGDARSLSIAAASIIAKVVRDRIMKQAGLIHPVYGFERHKGYGSKRHRDAIQEHGPCPLHRFSFSPMRDNTWDLKSRQ